MWCILQVLPGMMPHPMAPFLPDEVRQDIIDLAFAGDVRHTVATVEEGEFPLGETSRCSHCGCYPNVPSRLFVTTKPIIAPQAKFKTVVLYSQSTDRNNKAHDLSAILLQYRYNPCIWRI